LFSIDILAREGSPTYAHTAFLETFQIWKLFRFLSRVLRKQFRFH